MDKWDFCSFAYLNKPSWWHFFIRSRYLYHHHWHCKDQSSSWLVSPPFYFHDEQGSIQDTLDFQPKKAHFHIFNNQHRWCSLNWNCRFLYQFLFFDISLLFYWRLFLLVIPFFSFHDIFKAVVMAIKLTLANGIFFMKELRIVSRIIFAHFEETGKILSLSK